MKIAILTFAASAALATFATPALANDFWGNFAAGFAAGMAGQTYQPQPQYYYQQAPALTPQRNYTFTDGFRPPVNCTEWNGFVSCN